MRYRNIIKFSGLLVIITMMIIISSKECLAATATSTIYMTVGDNASLPQEVRGKGYIYKCSNDKILKVLNKGKLYAKKRGNVSVTVTKNAQKVKKKYIIKIHEKVKKLKWKDKIDNLLIDEQYTCAISYKVKSKKNVSFNWSSSNKNVAVVNKNGIVKGIEKGETVISCKVKGQKNAKISFKLKVYEKPVQTFKLNNNNNTTVKFEVSKLHNGDAKFFGDKIITSVGGNLNIFGMDGCLINRYEDVKTSWVDSISDEGLIIYGNFNKEIGIVALDSNYNVKYNNTIIKSDNLLIDPTISKIDDKYYITVTEIKGTVNNSYSAIENGEYWIHLYVSDNLTTWQYITDIEHMNNNLEDVDFMCFDDVMYAVYEIEELDKGNSAIVMRSSSDNGYSWSNPIVLLESDCDHEPVGIYRDMGKYILCYSCDKEYPGESYMGGKAYYSVYDQNWNCIEKDNAITTEIDKGILWYDYKIMDNKEYFLFAKDYFNTCDMVVEYR